MSKERDSLSAFYESKFKKKEYGGKAVYLNPNPGHYHQKIIRIVRKHSKSKPLKILDVGCATGYLGAELKKFGNTVYGIEIAENAAEKAKEVLDDVVCGDIAAMNSLPWKKETFDYIILSDVLEHLFDPKEVLLKLGVYLKPGGRILVVIPNIAYYSIRIMLLRGKWEYKSSGILDYGHIRFFTKKSGTMLFKESGYVIEGITPYMVLPFPLNIMDKKFGNVFTKVFNRIYDDLFAYTYLFILKKKEAKL